MTTTGYVRQSAAGIVDGSTISASLFNNEYNQLQSAFDVTVGHTHDGTVGGGQKISLANSVTGTLGLSTGGTNASLTASNGGVVYSTASAFAILSGTATANKVLLSGSTAAPTWSTAVYPVTTTINQLLYSSSANTIVGLATGNSGVLITSSGGVPSISSTLPSAVQANITALGTIASGTWNGTAIVGQYGGTGVANTGKTITLGGNLVTSGAFNTTLTVTADSNVTLPTTGTLISSSVITLASLTTAGALATVGTITSGVWNGTIVTGTYGGTGVNNASKTITLGGNLVTSGAFNTTLTVTADTNVTLPTSGTLVTSAVTSLSSLATVGTITSGTWSGTAITVAKGGTGLGTLTLNNVILGNGTSTPQFVAPGTSGNVLTSDGTTWASAAASGGITSNKITNSLSADVTMTTGGTYYDGPSVAQGSTGTWFASGTITISPGGSGELHKIKLWDGTTVIASTVIHTNDNSAFPVSLSGFLTSPAGNIRMSATTTSNASSSDRIVFNSSGESKDSTITAFRIV